MLQYLLKEYLTACKNYNSNFILYIFSVCYNLIGIHLGLAGSAALSS